MTDTEGEIIRDKDGVLFNCPSGAPQSAGDPPDGEVPPRLMVCISPSTDAEHLVRLGKQHADCYQIPWIVVTVDTRAKFDERHRGYLHAALLLADQLGAEIAQLYGEDAVRELPAFAHCKGVTHLLFGRDQLQGWRYRLGLSTAARLLRHGHAFQIIVAGNGHPRKTSLLARNADRVVTQQVLLKEIWGPEQWDNTHYLRILVARLRQKLQDDPSNPRLIQTEQGVGYRLLTE